MGSSLCLRYVQVISLMYPSSRRVLRKACISLDASIVGSGLGLGLGELPSFCYSFHPLVLIRQPPGKKSYLLVKVQKGSSHLQLLLVMKVFSGYEGIFVIATLAMKVLPFAMKVYTLVIKV